MTLSAQTVADLTRPLPLIVRRIVAELYLRAYWRAQEKREKISASALRQSERGTLIEAVFRSYPFKTVLELGCGAGQNLLLLAPLFPRCRFLGLDKNLSDLNLGERELYESGISNVMLHFAASNLLASISDTSWDVVITCAALLYTPASEIEDTAREMLRICKKKLILVEQHEENPRHVDHHRGRFVTPAGMLQGYWLRDYRKLFQLLAPQAHITAVPIASARFKTEQWSKLATLIEVTKSANA